MKKLTTFGVTGIALLASAVILAPLSAQADSTHRHEHVKVRWHVNEHAHAHAHERDHEDEHAHRFDRDSGWHHDGFRRFSDDDWNSWRHGHWVRGHDGDELGWWWVVAGLWFFYPHQVANPYPYVQPSTTVVVNPSAAQSPNSAATTSTPAQYWYYCRASKAYYPYVKSCAGKWEKVPSTPPPPPPN